MKAELWRIAEEQATSSLQNNVEADEDEIDFLEKLVAETKPEKTLERGFIQMGYHYLIYSQFRYPPPVPSQYQARFKPPFHGNNVFHGSIESKTSLHEYVYHWLRQRLHLKKLSKKAEPRTLFTVDFDNPSITDIKHHPQLAEIMHKTDYSASHAFVKANTCTSILYPSVRHPGGLNVAVNDIAFLRKIPSHQENIRLTFDAKVQACKIKTAFQTLTIAWSQVS
ncbi:MAG TPA: RES family NAD+ phosphorylase [Oligoflexus sp.]|uniref:RES family NAD+ phosphorylase n=1 Tax=Oligoflexus sp. TaxID=1971216 RepID=UPI002D541206|nr:RES family NAD+ phosphorylase [Oligoflexus sp.]HYX34762.1 RES family NAD+ phosphorylase [Oligoflexus sp.]